jgi:hypothetical protein
MNLVSKTFYVPAPAGDAYRRWKCVLSLSETDQSERKDCSVLDDVPGREVHWLARWGLAEIDGKADFIPAQGGCVVYVSMAGIGVRSRLILSAASAVDRGPWRYVDAFRHPGRRAGNPEA